VLRLDNVHTYYGDSHILKGVSFEIGYGEAVTLLGRNGMGKSTTLKTIMGIVLPKVGHIFLNGKDIVGLKPHQIASLGVGYVPEERAIFPSLSVLENIKLPMRKAAHRFWDLERLYQHFPVLKSRAQQKGSQLSGGEQQMLAIARVLTMDIKLILLDEPTEGLAPLLVKEIGAIFQEIKKSGITMLLVEQNTRFAISVAERHYILYDGKIVFQGDSEGFQGNREVQARYLGV